MDIVKKAVLTAILLCLSLPLIALAQVQNTEPNAADLVRAVREDENWIYEVDSFYFQLQNNTVRTPRGIAVERAYRERLGVIDPDPNFYPDLRPVSMETLELAIDGKKRLRYLQDAPGTRYMLKVWDGNNVTQYLNSFFTGRELYQIDPNLGTIFASTFDYFSWPRSQLQSFWWYPVSDEERLTRSGRPEEFVLSGRVNFHGTDCYVLDWKRNDVMAYRWYVGVADQHMYGYVWLMNGQPVSEHRQADYKEIAPGCWFPMKRSYDCYDNDTEGNHYLKFSRESETIKVTVNEKMPDDLFEVQFKPNVIIYDTRSGETVQYTYTPELTGKTLPTWDGINIDITKQTMEGKPLLVCLFDMEQRPSRNCMLQLNERAQELKSQGIEIIAIQASKIEQEKLVEWIKENDISFPVGMIEADPSTTLGTGEENIRFNWGVKSLPWLILTDKEHVVTDEGFSINERDEKITEAEYTNYNEIDIPAEPEQLRLFLLKGYTSAKSVIDDVKVEYQRSQIPVNPLLLSPAMREKLNIDETISDEELLTSTDVCEYIQKNNKERWVVLNVGKTAPEEDVSYRSELVRTEDTPRFKVFDGQYILDYSRVNGSFTNVGRAILELSKTSFFESTDLLSECAPVRFFGYWPGLMPDNVLSSPQVEIETKPEIIDGLLTYKVSAPIDIPDYTYEMTYWLSPERSCLPVKIEVWGNGKFRRRLETKEFIELEDGRWVIKSILQRNYINRDDQEEPQELVNFLSSIRKIELHPEIDEDVIFNTSPDSLPKGADINDNRSVTPLRYINDPAPSLIDKPLPNLKNFTFNPGLADYTGGMILVCFFDYEQRPSRNCILQLSERAQELKSQGIEIVAVHASKIEQEKLDEWTKENDISFPVGIIQEDEENIRFTWGVKSLPWLILTDTQHIVTAEGFSINELTQKISILSNTSITDETEAQND